VLGEYVLALAGEKAKFAALKVGYDGNADDDIDDAGDDLVVSSPFGSTAITPSHDDNGNLTDDGTYKYTYDAWNRLVKATLNDTDITIQQAEFDGLGRRIKKTVTNSGDLDGTTVYLYHRHQIIETRNGSDEVTLQVYPGTRYIDEVVGLRVKDQGRLYAHQDANWNVTALTDLTGRVIEQYWYSPYGQLEAHVAAHPFDFDDDGDVDAQDIAAGTSGGTCWGDYDGASGDCKRLDADGDRDIDVDDYTIINNFLAARHSEAALQRIPAASHSRRGNLFAHQGLPLDAELASYQNRARQYAPTARRFMQRDPLAVGAHPGSGFQDGLSLFAYTRSHPIARRDPSGRKCKCKLQGTSSNGGTGMDCEKSEARRKAREMCYDGLTAHCIPLACAGICQLDESMTLEGEVTWPENCPNEQYKWIVNVKCTARCTCIDPAP
jgi:RHS repeat-associated protein